MVPGRAPVKAEIVPGEPEPLGLATSTRRTAGNGFAEADGDLVSEAGGELEHFALTAGAGQFAGVQGDDRGGPVDQGHFGGAVGDAGAGADEPGEVLAVQPGCMRDEELDAGFESVKAVGAGAERCREVGGHGFPGWPACRGL